MMVLASQACLPPYTTPSARAFGDGLAQHHFDADTFQRALRVSREIVGKARQHARTGLDQDHARLVGVDVAEVGRQRVPRQFRDGAGEFDAGRPGADDDEGQERRAPLRIALALGALERHQNAPPQRGGVLQRFQPGRERLPFVMAEIGVDARRWRAPACHRQAHRRHRAARACPRHRRRSRWRTAS